MDLHFHFCFLVRCKKVDMGVLTMIWMSRGDAQILVKVLSFLASCMVANYGSSYADGGGAISSLLRWYWLRVLI